MVLAWVFAPPDAVFRSQPRASFPLIFPTSANGRPAGARARVLAGGDGIGDAGGDGIGDGDAAVCWLRRGPLRPRTLHPHECRADLQRPGTSHSIHFSAPRTTW